MSEYTWHGWLQYNGEEVSIYQHLEFPISEELYQKIQDAIAAGRRLAKCEFCAELEEKLIAAFDRSEYDEDDDKPLPEDYDDEEEYQEALEEYEECHKDFEDRYFLEDATVYDPAEERDFKANFIGKYSSVLDDGEKRFSLYEFDENYDRIVHYTLEVESDENGIIIDISDIEAEGMESEDVKSSSWGSCHPNYDLLEDLLAEELEIDT